MNDTTLLFALGALAAFVAVMTFAPPEDDGCLAAFGRVADLEWRRVLAPVGQQEGRFFVDEAYWVARSSRRKVADAAQFLRFHQCENAAAATAIKIYGIRSGRLLEKYNHRSGLTSPLRMPDLDLPDLLSPVRPGKNKAKETTE